MIPERDETALWESTLDPVHPFEFGAAVRMKELIDAGSRCLRHPEKQ